MYEDNTKEPPNTMSQTKEVKTAVVLPTAEQAIKVAQAFNPRTVKFNKDYQSSIAPAQKNVWNPEPEIEVTPVQREQERAKPFAIFRVKLLGLQPGECQKVGMHAKCGGTVYATPQSGLGTYTECMKCAAWSVKGGTRKKLHLN